jgi:hypothetical protein
MEVFGVSFMLSTIVSGSMVLTDAVDQAFCSSL